MNIALHIHKRAEALALLAQGMSGSAVAKTLGAPLALVQRWQQERKEDAQLAITKMLKLVSMLGDDPTSWPPAALPAIRAGLASLLDNCT